MKINSANLAATLADSLDQRDKGGKNGKIEASVWNNFVADKGGKPITNYIYVETAVKSLVVYLCRQAKSKGRLISELGQEWIKSLKESETNPTNDNKTTQSSNAKTTQNSDNKTVQNRNNKISQNSNNRISSHKDNLKKVDTSYSKLTRDKALVKAAKDSRLERLTGGRGWTVDADSFITDIPYAKKFTGEILSFVSSTIGETLTVTSALGTKGNDKIRSPHRVSQSYCTHHNAENPKLDIKTNGHALKLKKKLSATGFFSRISIEPDHLDIQIKPEVYAAFAKGHKMTSILASAQKNTLGKLIA